MFSKNSALNFILLDNFTPDKIAEAVHPGESDFFRKKERPLLEASGGITRETIQRFAEAGVDRISVGSVTHSVSILDISLEFRVSQPNFL